MTAQGEMHDRGGKAQREDCQNDEEGIFTADFSETSDEGMTVPETQVRVDDLAEIAHKPDD